MLRTRRFVMFVALLALALFALGLASCEKIQKSLASPGKAKAIKGPQVKILFGGDTSFGENYRGTPKLLKKRGYNYPLKKVAPMLADSDFIILNLETPVTNLEESPYKKTKAYCHWTHVKKAPAAFKRHNIFTFALANNHTLDYGVPGLEQTLSVLRENGMTVFGAGMNEAEAAAPFRKTFTVDGKPFKMAVISTFEYNTKYDVAYNFFAKDDRPGAYRMNRKAIAKQIKKIKAEDPDTYVIVFPHWGKNYAWKTKRQTKDGHAFLDAGADLVIGHGGHTMQEIENYNGKWIIYGLGNFMFLSPGRFAKLKSKPYSYTAQLIMQSHGDGLRPWVRLFPIHSNNKVTKFQPRPLNEEEFADFVDTLLQQSPLSEKQRKQIKVGESEMGSYVQFAL